MSQHNRFISLAIMDNELPRLVDKLGAKWDREMAAFVFMDNEGCLVMLKTTTIESQINAAKVVADNPEIERTN